MAWWEHNRLRMIQNNLRETDANLDVDLLLKTVTGLSANTLMMNAGGIVAFYPTELPYHYRAQGQTKDLLGEAIDKAHRSGIKFVARFDFSKAHEQFFDLHPEWFYRTASGKEVNYSGIVHTCVNGYYQREYSLKIMDEVMSNYDVDGIFFNMFGYQTRDYSGNDYGICHCDNCKTRFQQMFGLQLPAAEDWDGEVYRRYVVFQELTTKEMLDRIHQLVKRKAKDIAISTYHTHKVDIVRKESNTAISRPHPVWQYSASDNVKSVEDTWDDKLVSNCCINAIDLPYRFTGVSKHEVAVRLYESIASGSGLDFCVIGVFEGYPDSENLSTVRDIFDFHRKNETYFGKLVSVADIALVCPSDKAAQSVHEYRGMFKMLKEEHQLFDVIHQEHLQNRAADLSRFKAVIVPDLQALSSDQVQSLADLRQAGVSILATGSLPREETAKLERLFGGLSMEPAEPVPATLAAYFDVSDKTVFKRFPKRDWIMADGPFLPLRLKPPATGRMAFVHAAAFGPPERAFGHRRSHYYGAAVAPGQDAVYVPWQIGSLYYRHGYEDYKHVLFDLLDHVMPNRSGIATNAPGNVELFFNRIDERTYLLQLLNMTGFNGVTYLEPYPLADIRVSLPGNFECERVWELRTEEPVPWRYERERLTVSLPLLTDYAAIVIRLAP